MNKQTAIKWLWSLTDKITLTKTVSALTNKKPNDEGLQLLNAVLNLSSDTNDIWFTALAILCVREKTAAAKILETSCAISGNPINKIKVTKLMETLADGCKLTKADAG